MGICGGGEGGVGVVVLTEAQLNVGDKRQVRYIELSHACRFNYVSEQISLHRPLYLFVELSEANSLSYGIAYYLKDRS